MALAGCLEERSSELGVKPSSSPYLQTADGFNTYYYGVILFADPQTITIDTVAQTLNRTGSTETGGRFGTSDRSHRLDVNHQYGKRTRHQVKLQKDTLVANPLISGQNVSQSMSVYLVVDHAVGYDAAAAKKVVDGFIAYLAASSGSAITKLLGGES